MARAPRASARHGKGALTGSARHSADDPCSSWSRLSSSAASSTVWAPSRPAGSTGRAVARRRALAERRQSGRASRRDAGITTPAAGIGSALYPAASRSTASTAPDSNRARIGTRSRSTRVRRTSSRSPRCRPRP
jgi:hypothetical protein